MAETRAASSPSKPHSFCHKAASLDIGRGGLLLAHHEGAELWLWCIDASGGFEPVLALAPVPRSPVLAQQGSCSPCAASLAVSRSARASGDVAKTRRSSRNRTRVLLMGVGRLVQLVERMLAPREERGGAYPPHTPIAVVERGSLPDQRAISTTLSNVVQAMNDIGAHRPPAMLVIGWAVLALDANNGKGDEDVLRGESSSDAASRSLKEGECIVSKGLRPRGVRVREGLGEEWRALEDHFRLLAQQQHLQAAPPAHARGGMRPASREWRTLLPR